MRRLEGHQRYLMTEEPGGAEMRFLEDFGNIVRWNGPFWVRVAYYQTNTDFFHSDLSLK